MILKDAAAALRVLRGKDGQLDFPPPYLILLHLSAEHQLEGFAFLHELRQDLVLRRWPVYVLGHSNQEKDILAAYDFLVAGYMFVTNIEAECTKVIELLCAYIDIVEFPNV
jgi:hypothetical protein